WRAPSGTATGPPRPRAETPPGGAPCPAAGTRSGKAAPGRTPPRGAGRTRRSGRTSGPARATAGGRHARGWQPGPPASTLGPYPLTAWGTYLPAPRPGGASAADQRRGETRGGPQGARPG